MAWRTLLLLAAYSLGVYVGAGGAGSGGDTWLITGSIAMVGLWLAGRSKPWPFVPAQASARFVAILLVGVAGGRLNGARALQAAVDPPLRALGERLIAAGDWPVTIEGVLAGDAEPTDFGAGLAIDVERVIARGETLSSGGGVRVSVGGALAPRTLGPWRAGRHVRVPVTLRGPQAYRNPGVPDQFRALALRGTTWLGSAKSAALVEVVERGAWPTEVAAAARAHARRAVIARMAPGSSPPGSATRTVEATNAPRAPSPSALAAGIVIAVLIGDRAGIPWDVTDRLQRAGTFHVIAISGGNIAILVALALGVMRLSRAPPRLGAGLAALGLIAYGVVASGSASVTRATVVAVIYLSARVCDVRANGFAVLWAAILLLVARSPLALFDAGFLLTCGATTGILLSGMARREPPIVPHAAAHVAAGKAPRSLARVMAPRLVRGAVRTLRAVTVATLAAEIVLLPIATTLFSRVTVAGLILNPIAIPMMAVAQIAGLAIVAVGDVLPVVGDAAAAGAHGAVHGLLWSATLVDAWPWLSWRVPPPPPAVVATYYGLCGAALALSRVARRSWWMVAAAAAAACGTWIALAPAALPSRTVSRPPAPRPPCDSCTGAGGVVSVVVLDVGQGDSVLLAFPDGRAMLIDAGGTSAGSPFDVGARVVAPALWALGVRRLDAMVLTHGHPDHAGGAPSIVTDFRPRAVWEGVPVDGSLELARVWRTAAQVGARRLERYRGALATVAGVTIDVLHPPRAEWERLRVRNDDSLVLDVRFGGARVLLPGDASADVERLLAARLGRGPAPAVTLLKVPHHGGNSASSLAFLHALRPDLAVVSVGRGNLFGHPAPRTLARYADAGVPVLRTDLHGAIAFVTDGDAAVASTWDGKRWMPRWRKP